MNKYFLRKLLLLLYVLKNNSWNKKDCNNDIEWLWIWVLWHILNSSLCVVNVIITFYMAEVERNAKNHTHNCLSKFVMAVIEYKSVFSIIYLKKYLYQRIISVENKINLL